MNISSNQKSYTISGRSLSAQIQARHALNKLCAQAIDRQIESGKANANHLRNRRRHLAKQILKRIPHASRLSAGKLMQASMMVLTMWGLGGLNMPQQLAAAPVFQHFMLDGFYVSSRSAPVFADIDGDGDLDAFVGIGGQNPLSSGKVNFYRNTGSNTSPRFVPVSGGGNPLNNVAVGGTSAPSFIDIDADGDLDVFVGDYFGRVKFYRNSGSATSPFFTQANGAGNPLNGFRVSTHGEAKPVFADIDHDGDQDVFIGEGAGSVKFYRNTQIDAVAPGIGFVADAVGNPLAGFNVGSHAAPTFADIDNDADLDVFVGDGLGAVKFYRNRGTAVVPVFAADAIGNPMAAATVGGYATPTFADIDNDGDLDAFVGEFSGRVNFFRNTGSMTSPAFMLETPVNPLNSVHVGLAANPAFADIDSDGDLDAFIGGGIGVSRGKVMFYRNTGTISAPGFVRSAATNPLSGVSVGYASAPAFADIDADGDLDAFIGSGRYRVKVYRNTGSSLTPNFVADSGFPINLSPYNSFFTPSLVDIDADGDFDLFAGDRVGRVHPYRNRGTAGAADFLGSSFFFGGGIGAINVGGLADPAFVDIDHDGDYDIFVGERFGKVKFYRNNGTKSFPNFVADVAGNPLVDFSVTGFATPAFADIDNDGDDDVFIGDDRGEVHFFENFDPSPVTLADVLSVISGIPATTPDVTANDTFKPEGPAAGFTITVFSQGTSGTVANNGNNTLMYTSNTGFTGNDSFTYTLDDGAGNTAIGKVNVTVNAGSPPAPTAPAITTNEDTHATSQVVHHDPDVGDTHSYAVTAAATHGAGAVDAAGLATYTPNANFNGADSFTVTVTDAAGATGVVTINVTVNPVNDPPAPTAPSITTSKATTATSQVAHNDPDVGDTHTYAVTAIAANGVVTVDATGLATYTPNTGFAGNDSFTVTVTDAAGATGSVIINVTVTTPTLSTVGLSLNNSAFNSTTNKNMILTASVVASNPVTNADVYVALQLPDGTLLVMQADGSFSTALTPLVSNISVPDFTGSIFNFTFSGAEPVGNYTWFAALTQPGTLNVIGTLAVAPFSFAP